MKLNLCNVPFTRRNSYMAISYLTEDFRLFGRSIGNHDGLYLRSVRGQCRMSPLIARLVPTVSGKEAEYTYEATESVLTIFAEDKRIELTFAEENVLLIRGTGEGIGLNLEEIATESSIYDYLLPVPWNGKTFYEANLFKSDSKYIMAAQEGFAEVCQDWKMQTAVSARICFKEQNGCFTAVVEEAQKEWRFREYRFDFDSEVSKIRAEIQQFIATMPEVPEEMGALKEQAAYIIWANQVKKEGRLTRDAVYPSKNWMFGAFSWDQCFTAQALSWGRPGEAWDQLMIMFDYQDATGRIPDAVTDSSESWNFCKPPVHGWTLTKMLENMTITTAQAEEAYEKLSNWTNWWYNYRDADQDGICEYFHGNDSGWDNATVFRDSVNIESPDLSAELVLQEEALSELADKLGKREEARYWKSRAKKQMDDLLKHCFSGNEPVATDRVSQKKVEAECLLPYMVIILGDRLPEEKRSYIVKALKEEFLTEYGISTEKVKSPFYEPDGYWRGPIWAPTTMMVLDGLYQVGEKEFVKDVARRFVRLVEQSGFSENYDSLTGAGNRDRAFSWTASTLLVIAHRYLM